MKANELRIGNYYYEFMIPKIVDALMFVKLSQIEHANKIAIDVSPIPLTEEWLLKFGFELKDKVNMGFIKQINYPHMKNYLYANSKHYTTALWDESNQIEFFTSPCQYIHQLQNLYFALTGGELIECNQ